MRNKKFVVIGGGTGVSNILRGLKLFTSEITAVVTMADDGGGSGLLRREMGILPPGDLRNALVALANSSSSMEKLLQFRFKRGPLEGQNFGNLLIASLTEIYQDFETAIYEAAKVLNISGRVFPVTLDNVHLEAEFENSNRCIGESKIGEVAFREKTRIKRLSNFPRRAQIFSRAEEAILDADAIILGPGSLYTSVISNLIVKGVPEAIRKSSARVYYIENIMTEKGETDSYSISDHIRAIKDHGGDFIDRVLINTKVPEAEILKRYEEKNQTYIDISKEDLDYLKSENMKVIMGNFINDDQDCIRHSSIRICGKIMEDLDS